MQKDAAEILNDEKDAAKKKSDKTKVQTLAEFREWKKKCLKAESKDTLKICSNMMWGFGMK
jgi:hypothetical protein